MGGLLVVNFQSLLLLKPAGCTMEQGLVPPIA